MKSLSQTDTSRSSPILANAPDSYWYRRARWVWMGMFLCSLGLSIIGIPALGYRTYEECRATVWNVPIDTCIAYVMVWRCLFAAICFVTSALLVRAQARNWVALLLALTLTTLGATESLLTTALINADLPWSWPFWSWAVYLLRALAQWGCPILLYVFPDGRFVPRWTRPLAVLWTLCVVAWLLNPDLPFNMIYGDTWRRTRELSLVIALGWFGTGIVAHIYRYVHLGDPWQRQQIRWATAGLIAAVLGSLLYYVPPHWWHGVEASTQIPGMLLKVPLFTIAVALGPAGIGFALLRHQIWDIDIVINRTLVYATLTSAIVALYTIVFSWLSAMLHDRGMLVVSLAATGLILIVFQPLRDWLQRRVNRALYGERDEPYQILAQLGKRLEETVAPDAMLPTVVDTVAQTLNLPYVAIELAASDGTFCPEAFCGRPTESQLELPLIYQSELVGRLVVARRVQREPFTGAEQQLLTNIAHHAGAAAYAVRLTHEIQRSRERLRMALEEERRRLRRNLHDGLGPALASQAYTIDAANLLLERDPGGAAELLQALKDQSRSIIADIRHLVYNLRPPALDDLGLIDALHEHIARYEYSDLQFTVDAPQPFPALPAAVEVAIYYIVMEAVTNVVRHAAARTCRVSITVGGTVVVSIQDDGRGMLVDRQAGIGLTSMRERAAELGGSCIVDSSLGNGTHIRASLPLPKED